MESHDNISQTILQVMVFLAATSLIVPAFRKARLSAVMGFLVVGVALGPEVAGRLAIDHEWLTPFVFTEGEEVHLLAELGVVFLLFVIGLEVSTERLWAMRRLVFGLGAAQVAVSAIAIVAIAMMFGNSATASVVIGLALALSSTAVVLQLLEERSQLTAPVGRAGFSILLFQDLAVVPILFLVGALSPESSGIAPDNFLAALAAAASAVIGILLVGRFVMGPFFRWAASTGSREVFVAAALLMVVGASLAAERAGLSMALGAFLAGLMLAETEFRHEIETDIEPFKGLLLGLFFVTVGAQINLTLIAELPFQIIIGVAGLFLLKGVILIPFARLLGISLRNAVELGFLLGQAGEFGFVVLGLARDGQIIPGPAADYFLVVVALSLFITPIIATTGQHIARRIRPDAPSASQESADLESHVVIAGYGRIGQMLGRVLDKQSIPHIGLETNPDRVAALRAKGLNVHFGDASRRDIMEAVGAARASAIAVTVNDPKAVDRLVGDLRKAWPGIPIFARAHDRAQARHLHALGAQRVTPETVEVSLHLAEGLLCQLGIPDEVAHRIIEDEREAEIMRVHNNDASNDPT